MYYSYVNGGGRHVGDVHILAPDGEHRRLMGGGYLMVCGVTMHTLMEDDGLALWMHKDLPDGVPHCTQGCFPESLDALAKAVRDKYGPPLIGTYGHSLDFTLKMGQRVRPRNDHASRCACCRLARMRRHQLSVAHRQAREARA